MKITVKNGKILSSEKKKTDKGGVVRLPVADSIAQANGMKLAEDFVKKHEGRTFMLDKNLKISEEVKGNEVKPAKVRLAGTMRENGKYVFNEEEKRTIAMALANKQVDKGLVEDEKRSVMSKFKDQIDRICLDINKYSRNLIDGYEHRDFECHVDLDWATNTKQFISVDSGKVIAERALCPSDYQLKMDMQEAPEEKE